MSELIRMANGKAVFEDPWSSDVATELVRFIPLIARTHAMLADYGFGSGLNKLRALFPRRGALSDSRISDLQQMKEDAWERNAAAELACRSLLDDEGAPDNFKHYTKLIRSWILFETNVTSLLHAYALGRKVSNPEYPNYRLALMLYAQKAREIVFMIEKFDRQEYGHLDRTIPSFGKGL